MEKMEEVDSSSVNEIKKIIEQFHFFTLIKVKSFGEYSLFTPFGIPIAFTGQENKTFVFCVLNSSRSVKVVDSIKKYRYTIQAGTDEVFFEIHPQSTEVQIDFLIKQ